MSDKSILAVDDVRDNLDILVELLSVDYRVKAAPSGRIAMKIAEKTHPDLILLDVMMPEMDGYEVLKALKAKDETSGIPVVFVTANDNAEEQQKGIGMGAAGYLTKPVDPVKLKEICRKLLGESV